MKLEIGNFYVRDIVFGNELSLKDGVLTVNKEEALDYIRQDERITEAERLKRRSNPGSARMEGESSRDIRMIWRRRAKVWYMH